MRPMRFPEANRVFAKDQPEYRPLPAWSDGTETVSLWRFTWRERLAVLLGADVWLRLCNFGRPLQPQLLQLENPFVPEVVHGHTPVRADLRAVVEATPEPGTPAWGDALAAIAEKLGPPATQETPTGRVRRAGKLTPERQRPGWIGWLARLLPGSDWWFGAGTALLVAAAMSRTGLELIGAAAVVFGIAGILVSRAPRA